MNTPVSFKLAKLLKEKEFNEPIKQRYFIAENIDSDRFPFLQEECALYNWNNYDDFSTSYYSAPTIAEVVMWNFNTHKIWITVDVNINGKFNYLLRQFNLKDRAWEVKNPSSIQEYFNNPDDAYEAAIEHCLINLI